MKTFKNFSRDEFTCSHTGKNEIIDEFVDKLDELRERCDFPFVITSGYRDVTHPVEAKKAVGGSHTLGIAADISCTCPKKRATIIKHAIEMGFTGLGVAYNFVHVDVRNGGLIVWTY